jgi:diguanylate cyclase (GGDEF)-like protein
MELISAEKDSAVTANPEVKSITLTEVYHLFNDLPIEIALYDVHGRYKFVNKSYEPDEQIRKDIIGRDDKYYFSLKGIAQEHADKRHEYFEQSLNSKQTIKFTEKLIMEESNRILYYERNFRPMISGNNNNDIAYVFLFGTDLSELVIGQQEVEYLAYHDKLTGLKNRTAFQEEIKNMEQEYEQNNNPAKSAILFLDLNNFKLVNDSLGHAAGDVIIQEVASRLKLCINDSDMVFRMSGDDFTILLKNIEHEYDAGRIAEKINKYLSKPFLVNRHKINYLTASIGIVLFPRDAADEASILRNAESALFSAKQSGKSTFQFFSKSMNIYSAKRLKIEKNLTELVNKREFDKQFKILYQPIVEKVSAGEYKIIGSEALLRWYNDELGSVGPARFIPIAEETNLINEIGDWIFERAFTDFKSIQEKFADNQIYLSVNFSAKQLRNARSIRALDRILYTTGFSPDHLQLELTETSYLDDQGEVSHNIRELEHMGVRLALDDFGVGFASLSYLHKVPASMIKIDRSFVQHISTSQRHKELVKSIIMLGENLDKDVVAEGVEQVEDLYILDAQKCYKYQGYLFSEPIELAAIEKLLQRETLLTTLIA